MLRKLLVCGLSLLVALLCTGGIRLLTSATSFETNILALLPSIHRDTTVEAALNAYTRSISRHVAVLVRADQQSLAESTATSVAHSMRASGLFDEVREKVSLESLKAVERQFYDYPFQLVELPAIRDGKSNAGVLFDEARAQAFSTQGLQWLRGVGEDPLLRLPEYLKQIRSIGANHSLHNGYIHVDDPSFSAVLLTALLADSGRAGTPDRGVSKFFDELSLPSGVTILPAGVVFFAEESASRAKNEVSLITGLTLLLVTVVLWWVFRTPRAVIVISAVLVISFFVTLFLSNWSWNAATGSALHLITIGFGSSLIGVSSDYALHYFVAHYSTSKDASFGPLRRVKSGLIFGFATTAIGFIGIALSPFPGLQQLAIFSICGLFISLILVLLWVPQVAGRPTVDSRLVKLARLSELLKSRRLYLLLGVLLSALLALGLPRITVQDDIRILSAPSAELVARQREVGAQAGFSDGGTVALVVANSNEQLLAREEFLRSRLDRLVELGKLTGYRALSQLVPSQAMQDKRYALTAKALAEAPEALRRYSKELHLPEASLNKLASLETARPSQHLSIQACLGAGACEAVKDLYLGALDSSTVASIVALNRLVDDPTALLTGIPGVTVLNQADTISSALMRYREMATTYTSLVYIVVFLLLIWRYGASHAVWILVPPTLGGGAALAALALCGIPINVFSVFALLVLIGLSIDYAIFCAEDAATAAYTNFAVLLSAITTAISFGLLSFSSTPALRSFGVVLSVGVIVAALVAPVATRPVPTRVRGGRSQVLLLTVLLISSGCALSLPAPKISTSVASDAGLFMRLCPVAARRAQRRVSDNRPLIAALECSTSSGVIVVLNGYGLRVQTVTLQQDGQLRSEVSYLAEEAVEAEQLVRRFLAT